MQTSLAVFIAFTALYFASLAMPFQVAERATGWAAQATTLSGVVATFMLMQSHRLGLGRSTLVLATFTLVTALAALAVGMCVKRKSCDPSFPVHTLVFSTSFLAGAAGYIGFVLGTSAGLPLWATIVAVVMLTPVFIAFTLPLTAKSVNFMLDKFE